MGLLIYPCIFIVFFIFTIYRSFTYRVISKNILMGILMSGIIIAGIIFIIFGMMIAVFGFIDKGDISLLPYFYPAIVSSFIYWYGVLGFHQKLINRLLSLGGFIVFTIMTVIYFGDAFINLSPIITIIWTATVFSIIRIWDFDHMKEKNDKGVVETIRNDIRTPIEKIKSLKSEYSNLEKSNNIIEMIPVGASSESVELMTLLSKVDISNIASIEFYPSGGQGFIIKTPNIKRLAVYMTSKLGKTTFAPEELRIQFDYIVKNIQSDLSKTDFNAVQGKISEFVTRGGEVKIRQN